MILFFFKYNHNIELLNNDNLYDFVTNILTCFQSFFPFKFAVCGRSLLSSFFTANLLLL